MSFVDDRNLWRWVAHAYLSATNKINRQDAKDRQVKNKRNAKPRLSSGISFSTSYLFFSLCFVGYLAVYLIGG